jgi:hypothetical protein
VQERRKESARITQEIRKKLARNPQGIWPTKPFQQFWPIYRVSRLNCFGYLDSALKEQGRKARGKVSAAHAAPG